MKVSIGSRVFDFVNISCLIIFSLITLYPFWDLLQTSLSHPNWISPGRKMDIFHWVQHSTIRMYDMVWGLEKIKLAFWNSTYQTFMAMFFALLFNSLGAYPLSKKRLFGRNYFTMYFAVTMFFSGGLIPTYLLIRGIGMYDTIWAVVIPGAFSVWHMILMRTFYQSIPEELEEAAQMEGANDLYILLRIYLPLSKALYATMSLFFFVEFWNSWFNALIYLADRNKHPLQLVLRSILFENPMETMSISPYVVMISQNGGSYTNESPQVVEVIFKTTVMMITILPLVVVYPFVQKYFVKGVMVGSIKG